MKNSGDSPLSKPLASAREVTATIMLLTSLIAAFSAWLSSHGYTLYYGDAQAHLDISRSIVDSRQPGLDQLGTVWLPSLHLLILPFVGNNWLWHTGLAGAIPVAICFVVAGICLFLAARQTYKRTASAFVVLTCFALNPNLLYLSSIPMTETVFLAGLAVAFLAILRFRATQQIRYFTVAVLASLAMSLTRYDGWFLIPFVALLLARSVPRHRLPIFLFVSAIACIAPLLWAANSWWQTGNPLDFINGPYSAAAIQGNRPYPGLHNWFQAVRYYFAAGELCAGTPLIVLGMLGAVIAFWFKRMRPVFFLLLTPAFYVWSIHSSRTPIHVPTLAPFSYYNTRYGIAVFAFAAFATGALADVLPAPRKVILLLLPLLAVSPWILHPSPEHWICWKESEQNSLARRVWTDAGADFVAANYHYGEGILAAFGDLTGIFCRATLPLREVTHEGTQPEWLIETSAPAAYHPMKWAIAQKGDRVSRALENSPAYQLFLEIKTKDAPNIEIYQRTHD